MYEISLVPDVKGEMIKQQKIRNLVFMICVIVASACGGVIFILIGISGGQSLKISAQQTEIECRSKGGQTTSGVRCDSSKYGTAIQRFENVTELLTLQDQMRNINLLNARKLKYSRMFPYLDVLLPEGENTIKVNKLSFSVQSNTIFFDGIGLSTNGTNTRAIEAFKKKAQMSYYDKGSYMAMNNLTGSYEEIPSFCMEEKVENGRIIGIYHQGEPGCGVSMLYDEKKEEAPKEESEGEGEGSEEKQEEETKKVEKKDIRILRSYKSSGEKEACKAGNNIKGKATIDCTKGFYFESDCISYKDDGNIDKDGTVQTCPIITAAIYTSEPSVGRDSDGNLVASFEASVPFNIEIFYASNKHVIIVGPSRQNVTDSYVQVRDMFTEAPETEGL